MLLTSLGSLSRASPVSVSGVVAERLSLSCSFLIMVGVVKLVEPHSGSMLFTSSVELGDLVALEWSPFTTDDVTGLEK